MTHSSEEDWSIISSSDMDEQSTTLSVRYDEEDIDSQAQNINTNENDNVSSVETDSDTNSDHIESTVEFNNSVSNSSNTIKGVKSDPIGTKGSAGGSATVSTDAPPVVRFRLRLRAAAARADAAARQMSRRCYDRRLATHLARWRSAYETPTLKYKVESWQRYSETTQTPMFKVSKKDLSFRHRAAYELVIFLQNSRDFLVYYALAAALTAVMSTVVTAVAVSATRVAPVVPESFATRAWNVWDSLVYVHQSKPAGMFGLFAAQPVKRLRYADQLDWARAAATSAYSSAYASASARAAHYWPVARDALIEYGACARRHAGLARHHADHLFQLSAHHTGKWAQLSVHRAEHLTQRAEHLAHQATHAARVAQAWVQDNSPLFYLKCQLFTANAINTASCITTNTLIAGKNIISCCRPGGETARKVLPV